MTSVIGDAMAGNKQAVAAFDHLGLSISELSKLKADEAFRRISDAVANIPNAYERASVAQDVFGKGAKERLVPLGEEALHQRQICLGSTGLAGMSVCARRPAGRCSRQSQPARRTARGFGCR